MEDKKPQIKNILLEYYGYYDAHTVDKIHDLFFPKETPKPTDGIPVSDYFNEDYKGDLGW